MRLALECPDGLLDMVQSFADFDWILADRYTKSEEYAAHYRESTNIKYVDNSVTDLGVPVDFDVLQEVVDDCKAHFVVSPDWINGHKQTIEKYPESVQLFGAERVVGVLQGETPEEALKCLQVYQGTAPIAVPYRVGGSTKSDPDWLKALRRQLVVAYIPSTRLVHLLGFNTTDELMWYDGRPNIMGLDTDVPIRAGLALQDLDEFDRMTDTSEMEIAEKSWAAVCRNVALLRKHMP